VGKENIQEELDLVADIQRGDRDAFNVLMRKYHRRIFNTALRILGNYSLADEVAQDVFVRAYKAIAGFRGQSSILSWLYRITINLSRNAIKKKCRDSKSTVSLDIPLAQETESAQRDIADGTFAPDKALIDKEMAQIIQCAINALDDDFKVVVVLRDIQMLAYDEIAKALNVNIGTIKSRLHRARSILKDRLQEVI